MARTFLKMAPLIATAIAMLWDAALASPQVNSTANDKEQFAIYESDGKLPTYDRNPQWEDFFKHGTLKNLLLNDKDIEAYDWDNQAIILTEDSSKRISQPELGQFIAVLGGNRLYGGRGLNRISQMAVRYPVIYTEKAEGRTIFLIRASHDFGKKPDLKDKSWDCIANHELMNHFEQLGKLRHPWAEKPFIELAKSVHRIVDLHLTEDSTAIVAEYDLEGTRNGHSAVKEDIAWQAGMESRNLGPSYENTIDLNSQKIHRKAVFPYAALAQHYKNNTADIKANSKETPNWVVTVRISPELDKQETKSLDLIERINLDLVRRYGGDLFDILERHSGQTWSSLQDMKVAKIPVHWERIQQAAKN